MEVEGTDFFRIFFIQLGKKSDEFPITAGHCHFLVNVTHIGMKCAFVWDYFQPVKIKMKISLSHLCKKPNINAGNQSPKSEKWATQRQQKASKEVKEYCKN